MQANCRGLGPKTHKSCARAWQANRRGHAESLAVLVELKVPREAWSDLWETLVLLGVLEYGVRSGRAVLGQGLLVLQVEVAVLVLGHASDQ